MDVDRFDDVVRALTSHKARRAIVAGLAGALWAPLPFRSEPTAVGARKKGRKKRKKTKRAGVPCVPNCLDKICGDNGQGGSCGVCSGGRFCQDGQCVCPVGLTDCGDVCRDTQSSKAHCGGCGIACAGPETCCSGICANTQTAEAHCGGCGNGCAGNQVCQAGTCFPRSICPANTDLCAGNVLCNKPNATTCECVKSTEGNVFCAVAEGFCVALPTTCQTSADCVSGKACVDISGCCADPPLPAGTRICMSPCPDPQ